MPWPKRRRAGEEALASESYRHPLRLGVTYLVAAVVALVVGLVLLIPTVQTFPSIDISVAGAPPPIVIVGDDVQTVAAEFHMQPQKNDANGRAEFPDGLKLIIHDIASGMSEEGEAPPEDGPLYIALPRAELISEQDPLQLEQDSGSNCTVIGDLVEVSELPAPAAKMATDHVVVKLARGSACGATIAFIDRSLTGIYTASPYGVALRVPPIAFFDRDSVVDEAMSTVAGEADQSDCRKTLIMLDTYQLRATEWLGAEAVNPIISAYRTQATYYGGTEERPIAWNAKIRPPESGTVAPCVTQGVGIDLERPGSVESKALNQILAGFLFGLASGLVLPGIEILAARRRLKTV